MTRNNKTAGEAFVAIIGTHEFIKGLEAGGWKSLSYLFQRQTMVLVNNQSQRKLMLS